MIYTILSVLALVLVSGFVAYFGDILGRRMGKRRLSLFGLRPKYTAIVVTTITGMLIAILTLTTILIINRPLAKAVLSGERMIKENEDLQSKNKSLRVESAGLRKTSNILHAELQVSTEKQKKALQQLRKARAARDEAERKISQLSKKIADNLEELAELISSRKASEEQLAALEKRLAADQEEMVRTRKDLEEKQNDLNLAEMQLSQVQKDIQEQSKKIAEQAEQIDDQQRWLADAKKYIQSYTSMREGKIRLRQGEEITRGVIASGGSYISIRATLVSLLEEASVVAKSRGSVDGSNRRAVRLVTVDPKGSVVEIDDEQESLNQWTQSILRRNQEGVLVQVMASGNTIAGEQAVVDFRIYRNKLAFKQGDMIAIGKNAIDGSLSEGRILDQIVGFLQNDVHQAASRAGIVPVANEEPQIRGEQLDELLFLMHKVKQQDCTVDVRAVAERDIYSAGPLDLRTIDFSITPRRIRAKTGG